jgi:hypothetical protein
MDFNVYLGLDVHKNTVAVAIADAGRSGDVRFYGEIGNTPDAVAALLKKLGKRYERMHCVYESGPCGYGCIAKSTLPATIARSCRQLTRRGAPAITSRPTGAIRLYLRACRAPANPQQCGFQTLRTRPCVTSSARARLRARTFARLASAFKASSCVMAAGTSARSGKNGTACGSAIKPSSMQLTETAAPPPVVNAEPDASLKWWGRVAARLSFAAHARRAARGKVARASHERTRRRNGGAVRPFGIAPGPPHGSSAGPSGVFCSASSMGSCPTRMHGRMRTGEQSPLICWQWAPAPPSSECSWRVWRGRRLTF